MIRKKYNLSKNFRVKIPLHSQAIDGIYIPCVNPEIDIKSVPLYAAVALPKDKKEKLGGDYIFDESRIRKSYVPVKRLTNIKSNRVTFSEKPIILDPFIPYSIAIEYNEDIRQALISQLLNVEVESIFF